MSHLSKTKEIQQEHRLVRQMREGLTMWHLIVNHHESCGSLLDELEHHPLCSPHF